MEMDTYIVDYLPHVPVEPVCGFGAGEGSQRGRQFGVDSLQNLVKGVSASGCT
jgi:hypothetical protein